MVAAQDIEKMTDDQFRNFALDIISRELGLAGYARFLMTFCSGRGDYTAERQANPDPRSVDEIWRDLEAQGLAAKN